MEASMEANSSNISTNLSKLRYEGDLTSLPLAIL